jgi:hypothetical protein
MSWVDAVLSDSGIAASIKLIKDSVDRHSEVIPFRRQCSSQQAFAVIPQDSRNGETLEYGRTL